MEYFRIKQITESDFDSVIAEAGGARIASENSADYLLDEAVVELKLVEEEGFQKETRQRKIAELFGKLQPQSPVVVVNPKALDEAGARLYYNIVSGPIKTHVKKAAAQLEKTSQRYSPRPTRVLVILNVGYTALSVDEFKSACIKCVHNDTSKIDWVICGGVYFHGDKFNYYLIEPFEDIAINLNSSFPSLGKLQEAWGKFAERIATQVIRNQADIAEDGKMPVLDLAFEVDGVRYVKPSPKLPKSDFWPTGYRPRENTTGIEKCPAVAIAFPALLEEDWAKFKADLPSEATLNSSYKAWIGFQQSEDKRLSKARLPFLAVPVEHSAFKAWVSKPIDEWEFVDLAKFANHLMDDLLLRVLQQAKEKEEVRVMPIEYMHLVVQEIGQDKANDVCSLYFVSELPGFNRREAVFEGERMFYEHGCVLAATYVIKRGVNHLLYSKQKS